MKKLSTYLFLILFSFQTSSWADDIRDFQIEGMSVGDSALDYFSKNELENKFIKIEYPSSDEYLKLEYSSDEFQTYESIDFHVKKNDNKFIMYGVGAGNFFPNNMKKCELFKKKVVTGIENITKDLKTKNYRYYYKKTDDGKSYADIVDYYFKNGGAIRLWCVNWSKVTENKRSFTDNFTISINSKELQYFIKNKAHK